MCENFQWFDQPLLLNYWLCRRFLMVQIAEIERAQVLFAALCRMNLPHAAL